MLLPRPLFVALLLFAALSAVSITAAKGQTTDLPGADGNAIVAVIQKQLAALQADQAAKAFSFASPGIQSMFGTPDRFMQMVRSGYAAVYRPREVQFLDLVIDQGRLAQRVLFVGPDGVPVLAYYYMERQPDGSWRISGVTLRQSGDRTT